ncbi:MAG: VacB/RNase II family 3'-5' exoribonuclease [Candidatus Solibacter usitatus]|nr:VacB/RNase II family 3'-5' exoribonuclease [Candidatus Solibacter usitatus]
MSSAPRRWESVILERLAVLPHGRAGLKQLLRELGVKGHERKELEAALEKLAATGALIPLRGDQYVLPGATQEFALGRLNVHRDGYGFVVADQPPPGIRGDVFIPPDSHGHAMHGDRVLARINRIASDQRAEGEVIRILQRAHPTVVGEFRTGRRENYVVPQETRIQQPIIIPAGMEMPAGGASPDRIGGSPVSLRGPEELDGMIVNVEIVEYPERDDDFAVGRVVEILGRPGDFGLDVEITIRKHHLPNRFPAEALDQAQRVPLTLTQAELQGRRDFRGMEVVTIDGETARDFDDAVWVDTLPNGHYLLHVHIADVSHYVRPGTPIDIEAVNRGTSVYFPDRAVPMLPLELSTEICSLKPGVDRLCLSALLEFDRQGDVVSQEFCRGVIRSIERMTYTSVHLILEGDAGLRQRYAPLVGRFELMQELALVLNRGRMKRGSIDFDLPEPLVLFNEQGAMTGIARTPRNIAHRIIEEFMLAANQAVSAHLESKLDESIYRIHEVPDPKRVLDFEEVASRFGFTLGIPAMPVQRFRMTERKRDGRKVQKEIVRADDNFRVTSKMYQKLVEQLEGRPEERILSYLMLRSLKQARYSTRNEGHFALAAKSYTHFTSPIRRYPDLLVHRLLGGLLDGERNASVCPPGVTLEALAAQCSDTERRAAEAERELLEWKKVQFMIDRVGDEFPALVISTMKFGFFVELDELFVEGMVPVDTLPGERWGFQENTRRIVAERSRREIKIGDKVKVRLDRVDGVEKKLYFSMVTPGPPRRASKSRR